MRDRILKENEIKDLIHRLLEEIEEEDISISLLTTHYQDKRELDFFNENDRKRVEMILRRLSEDSKRHKEMLGQLITHLEGKCHGA